MGGNLSALETKKFSAAAKEMGVDLAEKSKEVEFIKKGLWKSDRFKKETELGRGASCKVLCVKVLETGEPAALKEMSRNDEFNPTSFVKEIAILEKIKNHSNVLQYQAGFIDTESYYIQTKLLTGGELFDRIHSEKKFTEDVASKHICRILDAMEHSHSYNIVHRDLKPENIVYSKQNGDASHLTIIDFGDAKHVQNEEVYEEFVGTAFYLPPEIVRKRKGHEMKKSDVWSIGVIAYVLVTGRPPFWGNSNKDILKKIIKGKVPFPRSAKLSATVKHFILNLVQKKIEKRYTIRDALKHPFIKNHNKHCIGDIMKRNYS